MALSKSQKKYISKNRGIMAIDQIAEELSVPASEVVFYLKKILPADKFEKLIRANNSEHKEVIKKETSKVIHEHINSHQSKFDGYFNKVRTWQIMTFFFILAFVPYINSLPNGFVSDDIPTIKNIPPYLPHPFLRMQMLYISIRVLINSAIYYVAGLNPALYRLPNLLFHAGASAVLYLVFKRFVSKKVSFIATAFFALHPIQAEAITWISGAPYSQSAFFLLLSFYFYLKLKEKSSKLYYGLFLFTFILGLYSDAKAVVLLAAFILYEIFFGKIKKTWYYFVPHILLSIYVNIFSYIILKDRISTLSSQYQIQSGFDNPFIQLPISLTGYFQLYAWPQYLSLYQTEITIMNTPEFVIRVIGTVLFFALTGLAFFKSKKIFFWIFFFLVALSPYLTPLRISWYVAERYAYIGTAGIAFIFAYGVDYLVKKWRGLEYSVYIIVLIIFISLGTRTFIRNFDWYDEDTLWFATYKTSPSGYQIHNNMGDVYTRRNDFKTAEKFFTNATVLKPDYAAAYHNLGITQLRLNKPDDAMKNFQKAVSINPEIWQSHLNMGALFYQKGDLDNARKEVEAAYKIEPNELSIKVSLATVYLRLSRFDDAKKYFTEVINADPKNATAIEGLKVIDRVKSGNTPPINANNPAVQSKSPVKK